MFLKRFLKFILVSILFIAYTQVSAQTSITLTSNASGTFDGYYYELWKDSGNTTMTVYTQGRFSCQWSNINNALFRTGKKYNQSWTSLGTIKITYSATYNPNGNSYLCIYGWSTNPLVEFYIVESWGTWRPPGASSLGQVTIDGGTYDIYRTTRVNQPSIVGTATFDQYWSVRTSKRTSGTVTVTDHFRAWASKGMNLGTIDQITLCVEGYQSSGSANITQNTFSTGSSSGGSTTPSVTRVECENMSLSGPYASRISSPFNGVALYANNDRAYYTQYFASSTHTFRLRGCSSNSRTAVVDLRIGGQTVGRFYFTGTTPTVATLSNVSHPTGNQTVELILTQDNGTWDVYLDYLEIQ